MKYGIEEKTEPIIQKPIKVKLLESKVLPKVPSLLDDIMKYSKNLKS